MARSVVALLVATFAFLLSLTGVAGSPVSVAQRRQQCGSVDVERVDRDYSPEWFLRHTKPDYRNDPSIFDDRLLFYTRRCSNRARALRCDTKGFYITIWNIWPDNLYNDNGYTSPELYCVFLKPDTTQRYYEHMSNAFARLARRSATVMHDVDDWLRPPMDGIFGRVEVPTIREYTDIEELWTINDATEKARVRGDIFSLPSYHRWFRVAQPNMYKTDRLLREPLDILPSPDDERLVKRAEDDQDVCLLDMWRFARGHPLQQLLDGERLSLPSSGS